MSNNRQRNFQDTPPKQDWRTQLKDFRTQMINELSPEEKHAYNMQQRERRWNIQMVEGLKPDIYKFLAYYKQNSGIFINNFFRRRTYAMYEEDIFDMFDFDISGIIPNVFDDFEFSMQAVKYLQELDKRGIAYCPITQEFIVFLKAISDALKYVPPFEAPTTLYRGCSTIGRNGVNGLVSTTTDYEIAEQFSRGTILKINVPAGTRGLNVRLIRPYDQRKRDYEREILLPPCEYEVVSRKEIPKNKEPNNRKPTTTILEINVKPQDLLTEFLKVMEDPPQEYVDVVMPHQMEKYDQALKYLRQLAQQQ